MAILYYIKVYGRKAGHLSLKQKLQTMWKPIESISLVDLGNEFFLIKYQKEENMNKALRNRPCFILNHFLSFYDLEILQKVGNKLGKLLKIDTCTSTTSRGRYARICIEVPLEQPLKSHTVPKLPSALQIDLEEERLVDLSLLLNNYEELPFYPPTQSPIPWIHDYTYMQPPMMPLSPMSPFEPLNPSPSSMSPQPPSPNDQEILSPQEIATLMEEMRETRTEPVWLGACHITILKEQYAKKIAQLPQEVTKCLIKLCPTVNLETGKFVVVITPTLRELTPSHMEETPTLEDPHQAPLAPPTRTNSMNFVIWNCREAQFFGHIVVVYIVVGYLGCILGFSSAFGVAAWCFLKLLLGLNLLLGYFGYCCVAESTVVLLLLLLTSFLLCFCSST
uniref:Uncharacterized protein LOC104228581 n=1 Tax=Nicotiana sylvestris TaxID=4096 RepID=A0A1U7WXE9_NICSY